MKHWLRNILILTLCLGADIVIQPTGDVIAAEGDTVTLGCTFETSGTNPTLFWYKQDGNNSPKFILKYSEKTEKLSVSHDRDRKEFHLNISSAAVTDSAVYYCAVKPTVTGNTKTLYKNLWSKDNTIFHNIH
uniref:Ig-like domain-containing protein n=1 Tax=Sparus aurata TaxID=8175 RepID=A0A671UEC9_SPAAU